VVANLSGPELFKSRSFPSDTLEFISVVEYVL
jgi:hypothetical protein